jgi:hypothetical protein
MAEFPGGGGMKKITILLVLLASWLYPNAVISIERFQTVSHGPLHEAFVIIEYGGLFLKSFSEPPPAPIIELPPPQPDEAVVWIPGYWDWSGADDTYIWVTGTWRRPPQGHIWIPGYWTHISEGWVRIHGIWSPVNEDELTYLSDPPPDPIEENLPPTPSKDFNYNWIPGYWQYDSNREEYTWLSGQWLIVQPHWTYVPPVCIWREKGFVLNPPFWDWPVEVRGVCFKPIYVDHADTKNFTFIPTEGLGFFELIRIIFPFWPNHLALFQYVFNFHQAAWDSWDATPVWWHWPTWWSYTWSDTWWLWWWWSHPNYPSPVWLTRTLAMQITPPPNSVLQLIATIHPPINVTPTGVVLSQKIFDVLNHLTGKKQPILPSNTAQIEQIQKQVMPSALDISHLVPGALTKPTVPIEKPFFSLSSNLPFKRAPIPAFPKLTNSSHFQISQLGPSPTPRPVPPELSPTPLAPYTPEPPVTPEALPPVPPFRPIPQPRGTYLPAAPTYGEESSPVSPVGPPVIPYENYSGAERPLTPMETEHHDYFMGHPQMQVNPPGPKANQLPGEYSTYD